MRLILTVFSLMVGLMVVSAATPKSFQRIEKPQWSTIEVREGLDYDRTWNSTIDILINDFDILVISKDSGYLRTEWLYSYGGNYMAAYRVRATIRLAPDGRTIRLKTEAQVKDGEDWIIGVDSRLVSTLKTDMMGTIGRTTR